MNFSCPHCGHPHLSCETRSTPFDKLVDTEGLQRCNCGAKFNYRCKVGTRPTFFGLFSESTGSYDTIEFWNIELPNTAEFKAYVKATIEAYVEGVR